MDIRITSTGNIWRRIDDGVGHMLIDALPSIFERVKPQPQPSPAPSGPKFFNEESTYTGAPMISVVLPSGEKRSYSGKGERATAEMLLGVGPIPEKVWADFERKCKPSAGVTPVYG
jgi:hypothetical protein